MRFDALVSGRLVRRYKRFFVDVELDDGRVVTAHCTDTGRMTGCLPPNARVRILRVDGAHRRLKWTWKLVRVGRHWVGVDSSLAVPLVVEGLGAGLIPELSGYDRVLREVGYGRGSRSRVDLLLSRGGRPDPKSPRGRLFTRDDRVYLEVKNTTLIVERGRRRLGSFPDAPTERGRKHLEDLIQVARRGRHRAALALCLQRGDAEAFTPADHVDPEWGKLLRRAIARGVEAYVLAATTSPQGIHLVRRLPLLL